MVPLSGKLYIIKKQAFSKYLKVIFIGDGQCKWPKKQSSNYIIEKAKRIKHPIGSQKKNHFCIHINYILFLFFVQDNSHLPGQNHCQGQVLQYTYHCLESLSRFLLFYQIFP